MNKGIRIIAAAGAALVTLLSPAALAVPAAWATSATVATTEEPAGDAATEAATAENSYRVDFYLQNVAGTGYTLGGSQIVAATVGEPATYDPDTNPGWRSEIAANPDGFEFKTAEAGQTVRADNRTVVKAYFDRRVFAVAASFSVASEKAGQPITYRYNAYTGADMYLRYGAPLAQATVINPRNNQPGLFSNYQWALEAGGIFDGAVVAGQVAYALPLTMPVPADGHTLYLYERVLRGGTDYTVGYRYNLVAETGLVVSTNVVEKTINVNPKYTDHGNGLDGSFHSAIENLQADGFIVDFERTGEHFTNLEPASTKNPYGYDAKTGNKYYVDIFYALPATRTITFHLGGGSFAGDQPAGLEALADGSTNQLTLTVGEPIGALPVAEAPGNTFLGWFTEPQGGEAVTPETPMPAEDIDVFAHWAAYPNLTLTTTGYSAMYDGAEHSVYAAASGIDETPVVNLEFWVTEDEQARFDPANPVWTRLGAAAPGEQVTVASATDVGTTTYRVVAVADGYNATSPWAVSLVISPRPVTVTIASASVVWPDDDADLAVTASPDSLLDGHEVTPAVVEAEVDTPDTPVAFGDDEGSVPVAVAIMAGTEDGTDNYAVTLVDGVLQATRPADPLTLTV
ncbi:MAG: InlB B-repeat-containing protein, partial [Bifidobacteriaceae bacterium]|nr:InlB B-repeat-containing protein [Bifidobacteriaceae bacterium]